MTPALPVCRAALQLVGAVGEAGRMSAEARVASAPEQHLELGAGLAGGAGRRTEGLGSPGGGLCVRAVLELS